MTGTLLKSPHTTSKAYSQIKGEEEREQRTFPQNGFHNAWKRKNIKHTFFCFQIHVTHLTPGFLPRKALTYKRDGTKSPLTDAHEIYNNFKMRLNSSKTTSLFTSTSFQQVFYSSLVMRSSRKSSLRIHWSIFPHVKDITPATTI